MLRFVAVPQNSLALKSHSNSPQTGTGAGKGGWISHSSSGSVTQPRACFNIFCAGPGIIKQSANTILYGVSCSFQKVRMSHDSINSNFVNAFVLNNPIFFRGPGNKQSLTLSFLELPQTGFSPLVNLKARDFFNVNGIKTRQELALDCDLNLSLTGQWTC
jgi:hypothetical protein